MFFKTGLPQTPIRFAPIRIRPTEARLSNLCKASEQEPNSLPPEQLKALEALFQASPNAYADMQDPPEKPRLSKPPLLENAKIRQPFPSQDLRELISSSSKQSIHAGGDSFAINDFLCSAAALIELKLDLESGREHFVQLVAKQAGTIIPINGAFSDPDYGELQDTLGHLTTFNFHDASPFNLGTSHVHISPELSQGLNRLAKKIGFDLHLHNAHQLCDYLANVYLNVRSSVLEFDADTRFHLVVLQGSGQNEFHDVTPLVL